MPGDERSTDEVAALIRAALDSPDLAAFADLLDPDVRWGAPDDDTPACATAARYAPGIGGDGSGVSTHRSVRSPSSATRCWSGWTSSAHPRQGRPPPAEAARPPGGRC